MWVVLVQSVVRTLENELQYQHVEVFADVLQHFSSQRVLFASVATSGGQLPRLTRGTK